MHVVFRRWLVCGGLGLLLLRPTTGLTQEIEVLPPLRVGPAPAAAVPSPTDPKVLPLSLDTVLRLAQDHNGQVRIARLRVDEALLRQETAQHHWLPELTVGPSYYRHDGGIQDFNGNLVNSSYGSTFVGGEIRGKLDLREVAIKRIEAERSLVQRQGELSKLSSEQLLDAASTYVDLLTARTAELVSRETERRLEDILIHARKLADVDPGVRIEAVRTEAEVEAQKMLARKLREGSDRAQMKLLYLLGLELTSQVAILDQITMFRLIDDTQSVEVLVDRALTSGPGVLELGRLLALVERLHEEADCNKKWIPSLEVSLAEGAFSAGPNSRLDGSSRFDAAVHLRWSINDLFGSRDKQRLFEVQRQQTHLTYQDLRARLGLGVREALEELRSSQEQLGLATRHIERAEESYKLSDQRLRENIKGRSPSEVLLAARTLFAARLSYLHALRDYDKAQLRLFVLTGKADANCR
jgi:outer membrane protein TolC